METTSAQTLVPKGVPAFKNAEYLDFDRLRAEGLRHIQDLSGKIWTDHNIHDPGITILEVLCYALTDVGYRLQLPDEDLFARSTDNEATPEDNFFTAAQILGNNPLTISDWRRILLDIEGVRNVWIEPIEAINKKLITGSNKRNFVFKETDNIRQIEDELWDREAMVVADLIKHELAIKENNLTENGNTKQQYPLSIRGVYKVLLELEPTLDTPTSDSCTVGEDPLSLALAAVQQKLHAHRNLCEDFLNIHILADEPLSICAEFELDAHAQPDDVLLGIFEKLQEFFSPTVNFYSLRQLLDGNTALGIKRTVEEAFEGRPLSQDSHGFVDIEELEAIKRRQEIHVSDIYNLLLGDGSEGSGVKGLAAIQKLQLINLRTDPQQKKGAWLVKLTEGYRPTLAARASIGSITFFKRGVSYQASIDRVLARFERRLANATKVLKTGDTKTALPSTDFDIPMPTGAFRSDLSDYYSIQHDFPSVYGIGEGNLLNSASAKRQRQALQLKGYLLFYDYILTNFLAQLSQVRSSFSTQIGNQPAVGKLSSVPLLDDLLPFIKKSNTANVGTTLATSTRSYTTPYERDHARNQLIAAFDDNNIRVETQQDLKSKDYYILLSIIGNQQVVLRSKKGYQSLESAKATATAWKFIGGLEGSYETYNDAAQKRYSFSLMNTPPQYESYLQSLAGDETTFVQKKNRLFDHLLHRFSEDFTDYTLLMFAMSKTADAPLLGSELESRFAKDKAAFLSHYDDISRNRAKGFDYTDPRHVWTGDNISGLENRVNKLIGIEQRDTKTLNYFEVFPHEPLVGFNIFDSKNEITLFQSSQYYANQLTADRVLGSIKQRLQNRNNYARTEHIVERVYGFQLLDAHGCPILDHPETYATAERRDAMLDYIAGIASGDGIMHDFVADTEGVFFQINDADNQPLFRTTIAVKDSTTALKQFLQFAELVKVLDNWKNIDELKGRGFGFEIPIIYNEKIVQRIAHSPFYGSAEERETHKKKAWDYIKTRQIFWKAVPLPSRYNWLIADRPVNKSHLGSGLVLLKSIHFFKKKRQTAHAAYDALEAIAKDLIEIKHLDDDTWTFYVLQKSTYQEDTPTGVVEKTLMTRIASPIQSFKSEEACKSAIRHLKKVIKDLMQCEWSAFDKKEIKADDIWQGLQTPNSEILCVPDVPRYRLQWTDAKGKTHLWGEKTDFHSAESALMALLKIEPSLTTSGASSGILKDLATDINNYFFSDENDGCALGFGIAADSDAKALAADWFSDKDKRNTAMSLVQTEATAAAWSATIERVIEKYRFEISRLTCDGQIEIILRGMAKPSIDVSKNDYNTLLTNLESLDFKVVQHDSRFEIVVKLKEEVLAIYPKLVSPKGKAETIIKSIKAYLKDAKNRLQYIPIIEKTCDCVDMSGIKRTQNPYAWRLSDETDIIATYESIFETPNAAQTRLADLIAHYGCCQPDFSIVWQNQRSIIQIGNGGGYRFLIRDADTCYWQSPLPLFDSFAEAFDALDKSLIRIMDAAKDLSRYRVKSIEPDGKITYIIDLVAPDKITALVESVEKPLTASSVASLKSKLYHHAILYPFISLDNQQFRFQITNSSKQSLLWLSGQIFKSKKEVVEAFRRFLDTIRHRSYFRIAPDICGNGWRILLTETLLDGDEIFFTSTDKIPNKSASEHFVWQRIDGFLEDMAKAGKATFAPTVDYLNGGYGFVLTNSKYRLAKHPKSYHTPVERELMRDALFDTIICNKNSTNVMASGSAATEGASEILKILDLRKNKTGLTVRQTKCPVSYKIKVIIDGEKKILDRIHEQTIFRIELIFKDVKHTYNVFAENIDYLDKTYKGKTEIEIDKQRIADININTGIAKAEAEAEANAEINRLATEAAKILRGMQGSEVLENLMVLTEVEILDEKDVDGRNKTQYTLRLAVNEPDGKLLGIIDEWTTTDINIMSQEIERIYLLAMKEPVVELPDGSGFGFEIRRPVGFKDYTVKGFMNPITCDTIMLTLPIYEVIWQHVQPFSTYEKAQEAAKTAESQLIYKNQYARTEDAFGAPTLELVNPEAIIATHPRTYPTRAERDVAWVKVKKYIHTEGLHLVEHLLLRPRNEKDNALLPVNFDTTDIENYDPLSKEETQRYLEGADPYSFIVTVVLPAWSQRLKNLDFRDFFDNTLRRELPAHVMMRRFWIRPEAMSLFEHDYQRWLEVAGQPNHSEFACRKRCFIETLNTLINTFPDAILTDCSSGGEGVLLDKTTLN